MKHLISIVKNLPSATLKAYQSVLRSVLVKPGPAGLAGLGSLSAVGAIFHLLRTSLHHATCCGSSAYPAAVVEVLVPGGASGRVALLKARSKFGKGRKHVRLCTPNKVCAAFGKVITQTSRTDRLRGKHGVEGVQSHDYALPGLSTRPPGIHL